ncbi:MAG: aminoacyl-tRNA hydrolase [Oscillospiraceae bacterium]|nr:aminoacyl-tRNA hydrolase [Oscillospiraceae bacterium]
MHLIIGLGNPGDNYKMTRHNIGFEVIDYMADRYNVKINKLKFKAIYGECNINGEKVYLIKPQTFMNLSGESVAEFVSFFKVPTRNIIVIHDDISLDAGRMRIRTKGSDGGHNGIKNIIYLLQTDEFTRIKIGVGAPEHKDYDLADYVLGRFTKDEIPVLEEVIIKTADAAELMVNDKLNTAMNKYNGR